MQSKKLSEQNFFGKWIYHQVDSNGNPIVAQTFNSRRRRNVSYKERGRMNLRNSSTGQLSGDEFNLKYTPELVRKSDGYKIQTGDCILYQEDGDPLEAWFIYNIDYKELERNIDVKVIRLVDWDFLEREYGFKYEEKPISIDKYNELIVFSEFDNIIADSWFKTLQVTSYSEYKVKEAQNENQRLFSEEHRFVRYLFDVANKCLREINYDKFKTQCTSEERALENFKRLISSGHGNRFLSIKNNSDGLFKDLHSNGNSSRAINVNNSSGIRNFSRSSLEDLKKSVDISKDVTMKTPKSRKRNFEANGGRKDRIATIVYDQNIPLGEQLLSDTEVSISPSSTSSLEIDGDIPAINLDKNSKRNLFLDGSPSTSFAYNGFNSAEIIDNETKSSKNDSISNLLNKVDNETKHFSEDKSDESDFLPPDSFVGKNFPVHYDDFRKQPLSLSPSDLPFKKRKRGKIVVNPDINRDSEMFLSGTQFEEEQNKQTNHQNSFKHKFCFKENASVVNHSLTEPGTQIAQTVDLKNKGKDDLLEIYQERIVSEKTFELDAVVNETIRQHHIGHDSDIERRLNASEIFNNVLFRTDQIKNIYSKLLEFVETNSSLNYSISGPGGSGKLYTLKRAVETFLNSEYRNISPVIMDFREFPDIRSLKGSDLIETLQKLLRKDEYLIKCKGRVLNDKAIVILAGMELILKADPGVLFLVNNWIDKSGYKILLFCSYDEDKEIPQTNSSLKFPRYTYKQVFDILKLELDNKTSKFDFFTDKQSGAVIFTSNEASRLDIEKQKSLFIKHKILFQQQAVKYLADCAYNENVHLKNSLSIGLSTITLIEKLFFNHRPIQHSFKNFDSTRKKTGFIDYLQSFTTKPFVITIKHVKKTESFLNDMLLKQKLQSLRPVLKFALWVLNNIQAELADEQVSLILFKQSIAELKNKDLDNPMVGDIVSSIKFDLNIDLEKFSWHKVLDELESLNFITAKRSKESVIIGISLINKDIIEHFFQPLASL